MVTSENRLFRAFSEAQNIVWQSIRPYLKSIGIRTNLQKAWKSKRTKYWFDATLFIFRPESWFLFFAVGTKSTRGKFPQKFFVRWYQSNIGSGCNFKKSGHGKMRKWYRKISQGFNLICWPLRRLSRVRNQSTYTAEFVEFRDFFVCLSNKPSICKPLKFC